MRKLNLLSCLGRLRKTAANKASYREIEVTVYEVAQLQLNRKG